MFIILHIYFIIYNIKYLLHIYMIYKVYIKLAFEVTKGILHWQITLFTQENPTVINKTILLLHQFCPVIFYKTGSTFISLEVASLILPSKNKLFLESCPFITHVIYPYSILSKESWNLKLKGLFSLEVTQSTSLTPHFLYNVPKIEA